MDFLENNVFYGNCTGARPLSRKKFGEQCGAQGMLKIRGDVKKSDTVATLLATKALQEMVTATYSNYRSVKEWKIFSKHLRDYEISINFMYQALKTPTSLFVGVLCLCCQSFFCFGVFQDGNCFFVAR